MSVLVFFAGTVPVLLALMALVVDGGVAFNQATQLQVIADDTARVAAEGLAVATYYQTDRPALDTVAAVVAANAYIGDVAPGVRLVVTATPAAVVVRATETVALPFGTVPWTVRATGTAGLLATPRRGSGERASASTPAQVRAAGRDG